MHLREKRIAGEIPDTLVLLEHPPVITLGRRAGREDILISEETARREGVDIVPIDRGGEVTYHGPGQLVGYLIFDIALTGGSIRDFVYLLEEGLIRVLDKGWGVKAGRSAEHRGVWVGDEKIAALGLSVSRHVTMHGFALNVNTDLRHFRWIVPCGIRDKGVTSLEKITGSAVPMEKVKTRAAAELAEVFGFEGVETADFPERKKHEG
jgi:lipoyl(octanoyl) transferase